MNEDAEILYTQAMIISEFSAYLSKLEAESSRLQKTEILAGLLAQLDQQELTPALYLLQGRLVPEYDSLEFQLSEKMVLRALAEWQTTRSQSQTKTDLFGAGAAEEQVTQLHQLYKKLGDVGDVAATLIDRTSSHLSLTEYYDWLVKVARVEGVGSQAEKITQLVELFDQLDTLSCKYSCRLIIGKLRLGFSTMTLLDALSWSIYGNKSVSKQLELLWQKRADIGKLAQDFYTLTKQDQVLSPDKVTVELGVPIVPALCQRLNSAQEIIDKLGSVYAEPKFDGMRLQVHIDQSTSTPHIKAYTRNLQEVSTMFPELATVAKGVTAQQIILDGEIIGFDPITDSLVAFQESSTRRRKHGVTVKADQLPMRFFVFDVLFMDGEELLRTPLSERKIILQKVLKKNSNLAVADYINTTDAATLAAFHTEQLAAGFEGAVIKKNDSFYHSGRKGWHWVKIKEPEGTTGKLTDTVDAVVMGYYRGKGKRAEFELGSLLLGLPDGEVIKTISKLGSGLSEHNSAQLMSLFAQLKQEEMPTNYQVATELHPDVWLYPQLVVEVAADELTTSKLHSVGKALRFPRLLSIRGDKSVEQATKVEELAEIEVA